MFNWIVSDSGLLCFDTTQSCRRMPLFQRNILPPSPVLKRVSSRNVSIAREMLMGLSGGTHQYPHGVTININVIIDNIRCCNMLPYLDSKMNIFLSPQISMPRRLDVDSLCSDLVSISTNCLRRLPCRIGRVTGHGPLILRHRNRYCT
jgi:hypothetical protein